MFWGISLVEWKLGSRHWYALRRQSCVSGFYEHRWSSRVAVWQFQWLTSCATQEPDLLWKDIHAVVTFSVVVADQGRNLCAFQILSFGCSHTRWKYLSSDGVFLWANVTYRGMRKQKLSLFSDKTHAVKEGNLVRSLFPYRQLKLNKISFYWPTFYILNKLNVYFQRPLKVMFAFLCMGL